MIPAALGQYRIEGPLGKGGMGEVYRATDTKLNRPVAIKILTAGELADKERRRRFLHEAQAASALNHPNIVHIYDIVTEGAVQYLVMEYVPGQTLAERIVPGGLPVETVVRYGLQLASALEAAHRANLIHRDVKPANVIVTPDDNVKLVDFGLAKSTTGSVDPAAPDYSADTHSIALTKEGMLLGTAPYMSPEQALGRTLDGRSEVFSLGAIFHEMLTGSRAFKGPNHFAILSAVISEEPDAAARSARRGVPDALESLIRQCLNKNPAKRPTAAELRAQLSEIEFQVKAATHSGSFPAISPPPSPQRWPLYALAAVTLAAAGAVWYATSGVQDTQRTPTLTRLTFDSSLATDGVLSADGRLLAFASDRAGEGSLDIWFRQVSGGEPARITSDAAHETDPAFSPDGVMIAFRSERDGGGVDIAPVLGGGASRRLVPLGRSPRFSPDGKWLACWTGERQAASSLVIVGAGAGEPRKLQLNPALSVARYPRWSPDGKRLVVLGHEDASQDYDWWIVSVETGEAQRTGALATMRRHGISTGYQTMPGDWTGNYIYFSAPPASEQRHGSGGGVELQMSVGNFDNSNLWRIRVPDNGSAIPSAPERLTFGTALESKPSAAPDVVAFSQLNETIRVWSLETTAAGKSPGPARVSSTAARDIYPSSSADGSRVVYASVRSRSTDIFVRDATTGVEMQLTSDPGDETTPIISRDGRRVAYLAQTPGKVVTRLVEIEDALRPTGGRDVCSDCGYLSDITPDGSAILTYAKPPVGVATYNLATGERRPVLRTDSYAADPRYSNDGKWLAFHTIQGRNVRQVFAAPLDGTPVEESRWVPITDGSGMDRTPAWSSDGRQVYFLSERDGWRCIWSREFDPVAGKPAGPILPVAHFHSAGRNLIDFPNASMARFYATPSKLIFSLYERSGNIWLASLAGR